MQFKSTFVLPEIDVDGYTKAVRKAIANQIRRAATEFVRAAMPKIPVQTGMARGSFLDIGRYLNKRLGGLAPLDLDIRPKGPRIRSRGSSTWVENDLWYYGAKGGQMPKTPESGAALTNWSLTDNSFFINSKVFHYTLQDEFSGRSPTAPWHSMRAGREAFRKEMRNLKNRLPDLREYMVQTTISLGPGARSLTVTRRRVRLRTVDK